MTVAEIIQVMADNACELSILVVAVGLMISGIIYEIRRKRSS